jgi:hypothetical protein
MSFFANLFGTKKTESVALVEIGPDSIAGGFAVFKKGARPVLAYATRITITPAAPEDPSKTVTRTLGELGECLIREGAPRLLRVSGSGSIDSVLVSVKAPWQETMIRSEKIERTAPFTFTKALLNTALKKSATPPPKRLLADEFVVGTVLDGYTIKEPVGQRASRVNIIILSSFIDESLSLGIAATLRKLFHTTAIRLVAAAALRGEALRTVFPHEEDYLAVDIAGDSVTTTLLRHGLLSMVEHAHVAAEKGAKNAWVGALTATLEAITKRYPLPRKMLLLTGESDRGELKKSIEEAPLASLRLSDERFIVAAVTPAQLTEALLVAPEVEPDLGLELAALFYEHTER